MQNKIYPRLFQCPKSSFFLFGPRGVGKTTLVRKLNLASREVSLLDEERYQNYLRSPGMFYEELSSLKPNKWVFVDEIKRLPNLLNEVHRLMEDKKLRFILTGSSARKLRRSGVNLLAGRAVYRYLYPLTPMEMKKDFSLNSALETGTIPLIQNAENKREVLNAYVQIYLKEEIQAEAVVRNLAGFARFLPVAAVLHGQSINLSNIARDCEVARPTVTGFFQILQDTLLLRTLEAYEAKLRVRERKRAKCYFVDPGIVRAIKKQYGPVAMEEKGPLFEGLIHTLLVFQKDTYGDMDDLFYWAPAEAKKTEVDFILIRNKEKIAIEVKATEKIRPEHFFGLRAVSNLKGVKRRILVYLGKRNRIQNGIEIYGFDSFVELLRKRSL
ncbi:MAG: AAA family ATPase [Halobacteriovoraceae bacterium]|nr:AAA family ATPase [Halobacteriovoraceae bacterium]